MYVKWDHCACSTAEINIVINYTSIKVKCIYMCACITVCVCVCMYKTPKKPILQMGKRRLRKVKETVLGPIV